MTTQKIAIVYDWMDSWGGIERVLKILHQMLPDAHFYTSHVDLKKAPWAEKLLPQTTFVQRLPRFIRASRTLSLPAYPFSFESLDFSAYTHVLSITSGFSKGIITRPETKHICYLLTPPRYLWTHRSDYLPDSFFSRFALPVAARLRRWDVLSAQRPDKILAISKHVQKRCEKIYRRKSDVLYPPFDTHYWSLYRTQKPPSRRDSFYLAVARLEKYKRIDLLLETFADMPERRLVVVGTGRLENQLRSKASSNVTFTGAVSDQELAEYYTRAQALLMPQEEDFGLTALESQFFGCPVIAYKSGGAVETVIENKTGIFFEKQTISDLIEAIKKYDRMKNKFRQSVQIDGPENVSRFSTDRFSEQLKKLLV